MKMRRSGRFLTAAVLSCSLVLGTAGLPVFAAEDAVKPVEVVDTTTETGNVNVSTDGIQAGVTVLSNEKDASVDVKGNVTVQEEEGGFGYASGVAAYTKGKEKTASASVSGDVTVNANAMATGAGAYAGPDIYVPDSDPDSTKNQVSVSVEGNVKVDADGTYSVATGIENYATGNNASDLTVGGDVSSAANADYSMARGMSVSNDLGGTTETTVNGNVSAEASSNAAGGVARAIGMDAQATNSGKSQAVAGINVKGDVTAAGSSSAAGVIAETGIYGDIAGEDFIETKAEAPVIDITIGGNVDASADKDKEAYGIYAQNGNGSINIVLDGKESSITSTGTGIQSEGTHGGTNSILIEDGDVKADQYGVVIGSELPEVDPKVIDQSFNHDILIDGELTGGESSVVLVKDSQSAKADGVTMDLTVWKVEKNSRGNVAEVKNTDGEPKADTAFEKEIKYIIKLEQPEKGGTLTAVNAAGKELEKSHDRDIAYEGDKVLLKVDLQTGYRILSAYNGEGKEQKLIMDSDGNYYIEVPKGGGVYLSVDLSNLYKVTFNDEDGTELQSGEVEYGQTPAYTGKEPAKAGNVQYSYKFAGWTPKIDPVTGEITYKAVYDKTLNKYDLTFDLDGGVLDGQTGKVVKNYEYGSKINIPAAPVKEGYKFLYWLGSEYAPGAGYTVEGPHTFKAVWEKIEEKKEEKKEEKQEEKQEEKKEEPAPVFAKAAALTWADQIRASKKDAELTFDAGAMQETDYRICGDYAQALKERPDVQAEIVFLNNGEKVSITIEPGTNVVAALEKDGKTDRDAVAFARLAELLELTPEAYEG